MKEILKEIQTGAFADEFLAEMKTQENFNKMRKENEEHLVEIVGKKLRSMFSWIKEKKIVDRNKN